MDDIEITQSMRFQANKDIVKRSFTGNFIYLLIWLGLSIPNQLYYIAPKFFWSFTSIFLALAACRIVLGFYFESIYRKKPHLWSLLFIPLIWGSALTWGILCSVVLLEPIFDHILIAVIISTAGLCSGGAASLVPNRLLTIGVILSYLLPCITVMVIFGLQDITILLIFIVFAVGMWSVTKIQHREYWQGLAASHIAKQQAKKLELLNTMDCLTGLRNRAFFDEQFRIEIKKAIRSKSVLSVLLIDIDYFKDINDVHGHLVGDESLRQLAVQLKSQFKRETDVVARYGGEEFVVILPNTNRAHSMGIAEQVREGVESMLIEHKGLSINITVSIGISSSEPRRNESPEDFFEKADIALYHAKHAGRNQVFI